MPAFVKAKPIRDLDARNAWAAAQSKCAACGLPQWMAVNKTGFELQSHHIIKQGRSDEPCNLLRLCERCHRLAELEQVREQGVLLPKLRLPVCLWLKLQVNPDEWNPDRLEELYHKRLPFPMPLTADELRLLGRLAPPR